MFDPKKLQSDVMRAETTVITMGLQFSWITTKGVTREAVKACELEVGVLPPDHKEFLALTDGAKLSVEYWGDGSAFATVQILGTGEIIRQTLENKRAWDQYSGLTLKDGGRIWGSMICFADAGGGDLCAFDPALAADEHVPVIDVTPDVRAEDWRQRPIAADFAEWLSRVFSAIINDRCAPAYWTPTQLPPNVQD